MSTAVSKNLPAGEELLWNGTISHWHYFWRWIVVLLLLAASIATFFPDVREHFPADWRDRGVLVVRGVLFLGALVTVFLIWLDRARRKYTVTNHRVGVESGIVSMKSNEIRIHDIRSINLIMKGLTGLIGIGRLEFSSAATDDAEVVFWYVSGAEKVRDLVRSLQTQIENEIAPT